MGRSSFAVGLKSVTGSALGFLLVGASVIAACGGTAGGNGGTGGSSGAAGGAGATPPAWGGAAGGQSGPSSELIGTWDVIGTQRAEQQAIAVTITASGLSITSHSLSQPGGRQSSMIAIGANGVFDISYAGPMRTTVYNPYIDPYGGYYPTFEVTDVYQTAHTIATRTGAPATDLGAMPYDLSGVWKIGQPYGSHGCMTSLDANVVLASCDSVDGPSWMPAIDRASLTGTRTPAPSAMFGMLGGTWNITPLSGGTCSVVIGDRSINATCVGTRDVASWGAFEITFGNGVASGRTDHGIEFSAQKR